MLKDQTSSRQLSSQQFMSSKDKTNKVTLLDHDDLDEEDDLIITASSASQFQSNGPRNRFST